MWERITRAVGITILLALGVAPLAACGDDDAVPEPAPGTITVSVDGLEGVEGFGLWSFVTTRNGPVVTFLGSAFYETIDDDPYSAQDVMHPVIVPTGPASQFVADEVVIFEPGTYYVFVTAAEDKEGGQQYACETEVKVIEGEAVLVNLSSLPLWEDTSGTFGGDPPSCSN